MNIMEYWNSKERLPKIRLMSKGRVNKLSKRLCDNLFAETWKEVIDKMEASDFCTGDNSRGWKADIDFLLANDTNYVKVLEGKYDNKTPSGVIGEDPFEGVYE